MENYQTVTHTFAPVVPVPAKILILGTIPSVKSRENSFYYGHPQNRFWKVTAAVLHSAVPQSIPKKTQMLLRHGIALWDVLQCCEIAGSDDNSIRDEVPNDIAALLHQCGAGMVFTNGKKAEALYRKHCFGKTNCESICLPSTSPANAAWSLPALTEKWSREILPFLR